MATIYHLLDEAEVFSERDGGAVSRWAANVLREGREVVICPSYDSSWDFPAERIYQLPNWSYTDPIHPILYRLPWQLQKLSYLAVFRNLLEKLNKGDTIYVHNRPEAASVLATAAPKRGIRIILHMHNSHLIRANRGQLDALRHTPIVFCSEFLRTEALAALPHHFTQTYVIHNGADSGKYQYVERDHSSTPTVIYTGRLVPYKGVHVLIEAMRILERWGVKSRCTILGGSGFGKSRSTRYTRALQRMKPTNTDLLGYKVGREIAEALQRADIFCCPSVWKDPFPLAPLEAMATGLPVVASNTGGLREMLAYGGGVLVPPSSPGLLAEALRGVIEDLPFRRRLGVEARRTFTGHFLWANVKAQYDQVLRDALS
jgi:spore coat protein SA